MLHREKICEDVSLWEGEVHGKYVHYWRREAYTPEFRSKLSVIRRPFGPLDLAKNPVIVLSDK